MQEAWEGFKEGIWTGEVDVRDFIQKNYTPYEGDESFLAGPTERTKELWGEVLDLLLKEREQGGVLDMDTKTVTGIVSHPAGYIDNAHRDKETIVGLQTDKPLKRALHVNGGIRIACQAASQHGYKIDENVVERYTFERKTHNAGVFDVYTPEMRACRSAHIITGLPDGYGRGRIIGRLPSCRPVRCRLPDQGQGGPEGFHPDGHDRRQHPAIVRSCRSRSAPSASSR